MKNDGSKIDKIDKVTSAQILQIGLSL